MTSRFDVLTVGRISVDLYAREPGVGFAEPQTFAKSVGGSPTNVAVAAARLGLHSGVITRVGGDDLGRFAMARLEGWGVDTAYVQPVAGVNTPLALAALDPPEEPTVAFYRGAAAPDTMIVAEDVPLDVITSARALWVSQGALAQGSTAQGCMEWLSARGRMPHAILDLDYRPALWASRDAARDAARAALAYCTVAVGNRSECEMALGTTEPDAAADALLELGLHLAVVKMGAAGVLLATSDERVRIAPLPVPVVCGLGAGDAFGGALVLGLVSGWPLREVGEFANAAGAHVVQELTCSDAMPTREQVARQVSSVQIGEGVR
jgi:5-dehydro-2-deoxygluconokinase